MNDNGDNTSFWASGFGKFIRWIAFLPIGFIAASLLQAIPPLGVALARGYRPEFNFLTIIIAVIVVSILGTVAWMWCVGVFMSPYLSCRVVAPNRKVASVIFGTLFCLFQGIFFLSLIGSGAHWVFWIYQIIFSGIILFGTVASYQEDS